MASSNDAASTAPAVIAWTNTSAATRLSAPTATPAATVTATAPSSGATPTTRRRNNAGAEHNFLVEARMKDGKSMFASVLVLRQKGVDGRHPIKPDCFYYQARLRGASPPKHVCSGFMTRDEALVRIRDELDVLFPPGVHSTAVVHKSQYQRVRRERKPSEQQQQQQPADDSDGDNDGFDDTEGITVSSRSGSTSPVQSPGEQSHFKMFPAASTRYTPPPASSPIPPLAPLSHAPVPTSHRSTPSPSPSPLQDRSFVHQASPGDERDSAMDVPNQATGRSSTSSNDMADAPRAHTATSHATNADTDDAYADLADGVRVTLIVNVLRNYGINGEHQHKPGWFYFRVWDRHGIVFMRTKANSGYILGGWATPANLEARLYEAFAQRGRPATKIVLSHNPDIVWGGKEGTVQATPMTRAAAGSSKPAEKRPRTAPVPMPTAPLPQRHKAAKPKGLSQRSAGAGKTKAVKSKSPHQEDVAKQPNEHHFMVDIALTDRTSATVHAVCSPLQGTAFNANRDTAYFAVVGETVGSSTQPLYLFNGVMTATEFLQTLEQHYTSVQRRPLAMYSSLRSFGNHAGTKRKSSSDADAGALSPVKKEKRSTPPPITLPSVRPSLPEPYRGLQYDTNDSAQVAMSLLNMRRMSTEATTPSPPPHFHCPFAAMPDRGSTITTSSADVSQQQLPARSSDVMRVNALLCDNPPASFVSRK